MSGVGLPIPQERCCRGLVGDLAEGATVHLDDLLLDRLTDACSTLKAVYHGSSLLGPQRGGALPLLDVLCGERDGSGGNRARSEAEDYDR